MIYKKYIHPAIALAILFAGVLTNPFLIYSNSNKEDGAGPLSLSTDIIQTASADSPKIVINPTLYNFGEVSVSAGVVSNTVDIKNDGKTDLIIDKIGSSCSCTTASLIINGVEGPKFGIGFDSKGWSATLKPEETAKLKIYYDPGVHGGHKGSVLRTITIYSNDPGDSKKKVKIELNQIE